MLIFMNYCFFNLYYFFSQELRKTIYQKGILGYAIVMKSNKIFIIQLFKILVMLTIINSRDFQNKFYKLNQDF